MSEMDDAGIREEIEELRIWGRPLDIQVDELIMLLEDTLALRAIVRDLAETCAPYDDEYGDCFLCEKLSRSAPVKPEDHDPSCTWRRALEWVAGHVSVTDPAEKPKK